MGLNDIWGEICRFFVDVSEYLDAGQNVSKYEKAAEKLENKIKSCQEKIDNLNTSKSGQTERYKIYSTSAGGELKTVYDEKVGLWDEKYDETMRKTNEMLETAREKAREAREKAAEWKERQAREESDIRRRVWGKQEEERQRKEKEKKKNESRK